MILLPYVNTAAVFGTAVVICIPVAAMKIILVYLSRLEQ